MDDNGKTHVAQVDRRGCALILADTWPDKADDPDGNQLFFNYPNA